MIDGGLRPMFHAKLKQFHWVAIESGLMSRGIPDSNFCYDGIEGWIEFKKTTAWSVGLRPEQIGFLLRGTRAVGRTFIAVRRMKFTIDELWLYRGSAARTVKEQGLKSKEGLVGTWTGGPSRWDWQSIGQFLVNRLQ